ncbi:MAG: iron-containing alcohol dehydrogenase, partial [Actinobacteria bacterium]|nr:iron-containing alcohol dehydrogenase [Actinomycetota bacterium]
EAIRAGATDEAIDACIVDRLEGVGRGMPIARPPLPVVAVPTTAGTGSEATRNAVISCQVRRFKKSLRSPLIVPRAAVVDPRLTATCPPRVAAASGLDCIAQLVEAYVTRLHRPIPRAIVEASLPRAIASLPVVVRAAGDERPTPEVEAARAAMSHAATCSGLALANSGLGLAHGVAAPLGIECGTPHGVACGMLLPLAIRINSRSRAADFAALERMVGAAAPANDRSGPACDDASDAAAFLARIERLRDEVGIPKTLSSVGLARDRIEWLAANSGGASMRGNPVELSPGELAAELARMHA